jgi:hypothetical protein
LPSPPQPPASPAPHDPRELLARHEEALAQAQSSQDVGGALLAALSPLFERVVLFQVRRGTIGGWLGEGPGLDAERLGRYEASTEERSVFRDLTHGKELIVGALPPLPAHLRLFDLWKGSPRIDCVVGAVRVRGRMVAAMYGDRGAGGLQELDRGLLSELLALASGTLERLIAERKSASETTL